MEDLFQRLLKAIDGNEQSSIDNKLKITREEKVIIQKEYKSQHGFDESKAKEYCRANFIQFEDNRSVGGAFWVYHRSLVDDHAKFLQKCKMKYKVGRGWWIK